MEAVGPSCRGSGGSSSSVLAGMFDAAPRIRVRDNRQVVESGRGRSRCSCRARHHSRHSRSWPLQSMLAFDMMLHPLKSALGAPFVWNATALTVGRSWRARECNSCEGSSDSSR